MKTLKDKIENLLVEWTSNLPLFYDLDYFSRGNDEKKELIKQELVEYAKIFNAMDITAPHDEYEKLDKEYINNIYRIIKNH